MKASLCKTVGCNNPAWSGGLCKNHMAHKSSFKKTVPAKKGPNPMHKFFMEIWKERPHYSELGGEWLGKEASSAFFHHILPKSTHPEMAYLKSNIILLSLDEHANVENDMYRYPEINERRLKLLNQQ